MKRVCFSFNESEYSVLMEWFKGNVPKIKKVLKSTNIDFEGTDYFLELTFLKSEAGIQCVLSEGFEFEDGLREKIFRGTQELVGVLKISNPKINEVILVNIKREFNKSDLETLVSNKHHELEMIAMGVKYENRLLNTIHYADFSNEEELLVVLYAYFRAYFERKKTMQKIDDNILLVATANLKEKFRVMDLWDGNIPPKKEYDFNKHIKHNILKKDDSLILKECVERTVGFICGMLYADMEATPKGHYYIYNLVTIYLEYRAKIDFKGRV